MYKPQEKVESRCVKVTDRSLANLIQTLQKFHEDGFDSPTTTSRNEIFVYRTGEETDREVAERVVRRVKELQGYLQMASEKRSSADKDFQKFSNLLLEAIQWLADSGYDPSILNSKTDSNHGNS